MGSLIPRRISFLEKVAKYFTAFNWLNTGTAVAFLAVGLSLVILNRSWNFLMETLGILALNVVVVILLRAFSRSIETQFETLKQSEDAFQTLNKKVEILEYQLTRISKSLDNNHQTIFHLRTSVEYHQSQLTQISQSLGETQKAARIVRGFKGRYDWLSKTVTDLSDQQKNMEQYLQRELGIQDSQLEDLQHLQDTNSRQIAEIINRLERLAKAPDARHSPQYAQLQNINRSKARIIQALSLTKKAPIFQKREPPDPTDLPDHPHSKIFPSEKPEEAALQYGWSIIGASRRGDSHAHQGKYREDDFAIRLISTNQQNQIADAALVALADGVGSSTYSRWGARAAVLGATQCLPEGTLSDLVQAVQQGQDVEQDMDSLFQYIREAALKAMIERAKEKQHPLNDLYSTLLVFMAIPVDHEHLFLASTQIGDGALYAFHAHGQAHEEPRDCWTPVQKQQIQGEGNEVQPFAQSSPDTWQDYLRCDTRLHASFLMAMTDGTADDIQAPYPTREIPDPDPFFFVHEFYQYIAKAIFEHEDRAQALLQFLYYEQAQSRDDRTLVCLFHNQRPVSGEKYV